MKQLAFEFALPAVATLENFVVGRNRELVQRLRALPQLRGEERFIYLWGAPGSGRTHLLRGALEKLEQGGAKVAYVSCDRDAFMPPAETTEAVAVDDVERLSDTAQVALFNVYNRLRENGGTLLASGAHPPAQLHLRADLVTRLGWGLVYEVHGLSDDEKAHALAEHAAARGFGLKPDVCAYLLTHVQRDMRSLVAVLDSLDRYSLEAKRPITVPLVRKLLEAASQ